MIAVTTYATKSYLYAWPQMVRRVAAAVAHHKEGVFIFSTDKSKESKAAADAAERELPDGWTVIRIEHSIPDDTSQNYKEEAQMRIAQLQGSAFAAARKLRASAVFSVESDVLIPPDSLKLCEWAVAMPGGFYDIAMVTYPNASFLGGRGRHNNGIEPDWLPHERKLSRRLRWLWEHCTANASPSEKGRKRIERLRKRIEAKSPDGNVFEVNAKYGWRRRGWLENAYPGVGIGAVLLSDWVGLGCTYLSERALKLANFEGYHGGGTQDLFLCTQRWMPAGLRAAVITHALCDHVKAKTGPDGKRTGEFEQLVAYHEQEGECVGHLRTRTIPWIPV